MIIRHLPVRLDGLDLYAVWRDRLRATAPGSSMMSAGAAAALGQHRMAGVGERTVACRARSTRAETA